MNRIQGIAVVLLFVTVCAWGQAPAPQTPAAAPAASDSVSGCLTENFGIFSINDPASSKTWTIKAAGNDLWKLQNKVVRVQGLVDPKGSATTLYTKSIQDTGSSCGSGAAASAAGNPANPATGGAAQPTSATANPAGGQAAGAASGQPSSAAGATPAQAGAMGETSQPGGGVAQPNSPTAAPTSTPAPQTSGSQPAAQPNAGMSGAQQGSTAPATTPNATENQGTPAAASPQGATTSNPALPQSDETNAVFTGCLSGTVNNYMLKANGKSYRLQGNTSSLPQLLNHQVEVTGEDFNGKAIQVNGARDLGASCKGK